jgi:succinate dehydrogenase/fumarate reductase flavoprotein subunit
LIKALELRNLLPLSACALEGSLARKESRGSHFRRDFPERDDNNFTKHTLASVASPSSFSSISINLSYSPVHQQPLGGLNQLLPNKRVY